MSKLLLSFASNMQSAVVGVEILNTEILKCYKILISKHLFKAKIANINLNKFIRKNERNVQSYWLIQF